MLLKFTYRYKENQFGFEKTFGGNILASSWDAAEFLTGLSECIDVKSLGIVVSEKTVCFSGDIENEKFKMN